MENPDVSTHYLQSKAGQALTRTISLMQVSAMDCSCLDKGVPELFQENTGTPHGTATRICTKGGKNAKFPNSPHKPTAARHGQTKNTLPNLHETSNQEPTSTPKPKRTHQTPYPACRRTYSAGTRNRITKHTRTSRPQKKEACKQLAEPLFYFTFQEQTDCQGHRHEQPH